MSGDDARAIEVAQLQSVILSQFKPVNDNLGLGQL